MGNRGRVGSAIEDGSGGKSTTGQVRNRGRVGWVIDDEWGLVIDGLVHAARRNSGHRLLPFLSALVSERLQQSKSFPFTF